MGEGHGLDWVGQNVGPSSHEAVGGGEEGNETAGGEGPWVLGSVQEGGSGGLGFGPAQKGLCLHSQVHPGE